MMRFWPFHRCPDAKVIAEERRLATDAQMACFKLVLAQVRLKDRLHRAEGRARDLTDANTALFGKNCALAAENAGLLKQLEPFTRRARDIKSNKFVKMGSKS